MGFNYGVKKKKFDAGRKKLRKIRKKPCAVPIPDGIRPFIVHKAAFAGLKGPRAGEYRCGLHRMGAARIVVKLFLTNQPFF